ncbi:MarR family winged helix-turn-helix transcriptional regulator [Sphingomonas sp. KC8]|uniref:MarR family winged helix-turn-helix transcriptional regulator n=1 Tax=Sphingomonas sp. KC8 TaxID=1030157 RepID=UPI00024886B7|nr:MarR family transcriptional regulator [Sphingomonas sp. KC8]
MATNLTESIGFLLHDTARIFRYRFDARARALGVTRQQWRALFHISRNEGLNQAELADHLEVERITLCRMIDRLAEAGLVERRADPRDRRVWRLHLLPPAHAIVEKLSEIGLEMEQETTNALGETHRNELVDSLKRLREALREDGRKQVA